MSRTGLGMILMLLKGEYNPETTYKELNVVMYQGNSYISKVENNLGNLPSDTTKWQKLAQKGKDGLTNSVNNIEQIDGNIDINLDDIPNGETRKIPTKTSELTNDSGFVINSVNDLLNYYLKTETDTLLNGKVDKIDGKGLSSNDYTINEKTKLAGLENYDDTEVTEDIEELYSEIPTNEVEAISIDLSDSSNLQIVNAELKGNSTQTGTPTPENEVPISVVTGDVVINVNNSDSSETQSVTIPLGNIELASLPNGVKDRIYKSNNRWYLENNIGKYTLNGSETVYLNQATTQINTIKFNIPYSLSSGRQSLNTVLCNRFTQGYTWATDIELIDCYSSGGGFVFAINRSRLSTQNIAGFQTWLSTHNTEVYYELATPVTTEITDTALINALEQLLAFKTYQNITHITNDKNAYLKIAYKQAIQSLTDIQNVNNLTNYTNNAELPTAIRNTRPVVKYILDNPIQVNTIYDLGEQTNLSINLPIGQLGDFIQVDFLSTATATTLTITAISSAMSDFDFIPEANKIYSLFFVYGRLETEVYGWKIAYSENSRTVI